MEGCIVGHDLSSLQHNVLKILATITPPWTLTGGAALVGFLLHHRTTQDLDLFWHDKQELDRLPQEITLCLENHGLQVTTLQSSPSFHRLRAERQEEVVILDLVAEPVQKLEEPQVIPLGDVSIFVDTPYEILVNKLCALLSRSELRDLQDIQEILKQESSLSLEQALADAPQKDTGFSPLVLAWVIKDLPITALAQTLGWSPEQIDNLSQFRDTLLQKLLSLSNPDS